MGHESIASITQRPSASIYRKPANFGQGKVIVSDVCVYRPLLAATKGWQAPGNRRFFVYQASVQILIAASNCKLFVVAGTAHDRFS